ncbi:MAG TPA: phage tail protein [Thermoanaerobaculia bacterium]
MPLLMDANGTRFHLLLGRDDWSRCVAVPTGQPLSALFEAPKHGEEATVSWSEQRNELTLGERVTVFPSAPANRPPQPAQRRGAAVDELGEVFWIGSDEHELRVARPGEKGLRYWPPPPPDRIRRAGEFRVADDEAAQPPITLRGLAIMRCGYLVAGAVELRGLLVFDLRTGGTPRQLLWPRDVDFEPFDLAATPDGGVAVLDRKHSRLWRLDAAFEVIAPWLESHTHATPLFRGLDGQDGACALQNVTLDHGAPASPNAIGIEAARDGSLLVLTNPPGEPFAKILRYRDGVLVDELSAALARALVDEEHRPAFSLLAHDFAYVVRDNGEELLYLIGAGGDQAFVFRLTFKDDHMSAEPLPVFVALRLFGGKGFAASSSTVFYDFEDTWVPLVQQNRGRYQRTATVRIVRLDGKQHDCTWHRLFLDACIPPECDVIVSTRAANEEELLDLAPLVHEPRLIRRGESELPFSPQTCEAGIETWELLFQRASGRYLQIELTLAGTGRATPRVRALRAYYPRFSYLEHYLPGVYRENAESASFLDRFMSLFEGFFTSIEDRIAAAQLLFDVRSAPPDAMEWLAGWMAVAFDESWTDRKRRLFLQHAAEFFEWRGTPRGLLAALRLALEDCPGEDVFDFDALLPRTGIRIQEAFRSRPPATAKRIESDSLNAPNVGRGFSPPTPAPVDNEGRAEAAPYVSAHRFSVFLPLPPGSTDAPRRIDVARRVLELEKPAHAQFSVDFYWTWFRLGEARLGEDSVVDLGSRSPSLIAPYVVGGTRIGAGYLATHTPRLGPGRMILGRSCRRSPSSAGEMR